MASVIIFIIFTNLTPCVPLSFQGEGEGYIREASPLFDSPFFISPYEGEGEGIF
jgi:hypothetical protein